MLTFHPLKIADVRPEGERRGLHHARSAGAAARGVPLPPGQHVGVRATIDGQEVRRTYSICSAADERHLRIGVRLHDRGSMSRSPRPKRCASATSWKCCRRPGASSSRRMPKAARTYCAFASGSGITPILGIVRNVLRARARAAASCCSTATARPLRIMFAEELLALKDQLPATPGAVLPHEPRAAGRGVVQRPARCARRSRVLGRELFDARGVDAYFLCGPDTMIEVGARRVDRAWAWSKRGFTASTSRAMRRGKSG